MIHAYMNLVGEGPGTHFCDPFLGFETAGQSGGGECNGCVTVTGGRI